MAKQITWIHGLDAEQVFNGYKFEINQQLPCVEQRVYTPVEAVASAYGSSLGDLVIVDELMVPFTRERMERLEHSARSGDSSEDAVDLRALSWGLASLLKKCNPQIPIVMMTQAHLANVPVLLQKAVSEYVSVSSTMPYDLAMRVKQLIR